MAINDNLKTFKKGDGATPTEAFTSVGNIYSITEPSLKAVARNSTTYANLGKSSSKPVGMLEMEDIVVVIDGVSANIVSVYADMKAQLVKPYVLSNYKIGWGDPDREDSILKAFPISIEEMETDETNPDVIKYTVTYKVADFSEFVLADAVA
jgi:hypothetical protein